MDSGSSKAKAEAVKAGMQAERGQVKSSMCRVVEGRTRGLGLWLISGDFQKIIGVGPPGRE